MANFLDVDESLLAKNLLIPSLRPPEDELGAFPTVTGGQRILTPSERQAQRQVKFIIPHPGLLVKTKELTTGHKVFINLCTSVDVPEPDDYFSDEQMRLALSEGTDEEVQGVRLPMSIGEQRHIEKDAHGKECPVFDVVINTTLFEKKILQSELYRTFMTIIVIEALEEKFQLELEKNHYTILSNKKSMGKLQPHFVRDQPRIKELNSAPSPALPAVTAHGSSSNKKKPLVEEIDAQELQLDCNIVQLSHELAKAEIKIPNLRNTKKLSVTLGADRIIVDSPVGCLDVFVPVDIHQEESRAEFNLDTDILTLHLPLMVKP